VSTFYLPSSGAAAISPSSHSSWDFDSSAFSRKAAVRDTRGSTAMTTVTSGNTSSALSQYAGYQWVYGPIGGQTISGDVEARVRGRDNTFTNLLSARIAIWIAKPDATLRATLYAASSAFNATLWGTTYANYSATVTVTSQTATNGDYLVMEVGMTRENFVDVTTFSMEIGDTNVSNYMYFAFTDTIVLAAPSSLTYTNSGQTVSAGAAMTNMVASVTGSVTSYAIQTGALPAGVSLNTTNGTISGTPSVGGSYTWTVRATGEGGTTDSSSLTMTVNATSKAWSFDIRLR